MHIIMWFISHIAASLTPATEHVSMAVTFNAVILQGRY